MTNLTFEVSHNTIQSFLFYLHIVCSGWVGTILYNPRWQVEGINNPHLANKIKVQLVDTIIDWYSSLN